MTRAFLPGIVAMAAIVVASNVLVQFLFGQWLTWGAFTYPLAFLITDVMNRVYGTAAARRVVLVGFVVGLICSLIGTQIMGEFGPLVTMRIAVGSAVAFLVAQLVDVSVFRSAQRRRVVAGAADQHADRINARHGPVLLHRVFGKPEFCASGDGCVLGK